MDDEPEPGDAGMENLYVSAEDVCDMVLKKSQVLEGNMIACEICWFTIYGFWDGRFSDLLYREKKGFHSVEL